MSEQAQEPTENTPGAADVAEQIGAEWEKSESRLGDGWNLEGRGRGSEESAPAADSSRAPADPPPADELEQDVEEDTEYASELAQDYAREAWLEQAAEWFETGEDPAEIAQYLLENVGAEAASAFYQVWKEEEQSEEEPVTADDWVWQQQTNARAYEEAQQAELRRQNVLRALDEVTNMYGKTYVAQHDSLAALLMGVKQQDPAYVPPLTQREAQVEIRTALGEAEHLESVARAAELKMNFHKHTARSRGVGWMDGRGTDTSGFADPFDDTPPLEWWIQNEIAERQAAGLEAKPRASRAEAEAQTRASFENGAPAQYRKAVDDGWSSFDKAPDAGLKAQQDRIASGHPKRR